MAWQDIGTLGSEKFKFAILNPGIDRGSFPSNNSPGGVHFSDVISKGGTNVGDIVREMSENEKRILVTLGNNYYIIVQKGSTYNSSIDGLPRTNVVIGIRYGGVNGSTQSNEQNSDIILSANGVDYPIYLFGAIDYEKKIAAYEVLCQTGLNSVGSKGSYMMDKTRYYNLFTATTELFDPDPWAGAGYGDIGGGNGELDLSSDTIGLPTLPISATATGFIQLYCPSLHQINELSDYMWGDNFLDNVLKLWNDPMDIIINLAMFPFRVSSGGTRRVCAGNVVTNVQMDYPSNQFVIIDCGEMAIKPFYDAYVDFEPYTTCTIFLPYIGYQALSMDDIMGRSVHVVYRVDLVTGSCCAYILCNNVVMYSFAGACSSNIPVSGQNFQAMAQSIINVATSGITAARREGGDAGSSMLSSAGSAVTSMKAEVSRSGSVSANAGMLGPQKPYLIFKIPRTCLPKGQNKFMGYPAYVTFKLSELSGFTVIDEIILKNCKCTEEEKSEIIELLKGGVIL